MRHGMDGEQARHCHRRYLSVSGSTGDLPTQEMPSLYATACTWSLASTPLEIPCKVVGKHCVIASMRNHTHARDFKTQSAQQLVPNECGLADTHAHKHTWNGSSLRCCHELMRHKGRCRSPRAVTCAAWPHRLCRIHGIELCCARQHLRVTYILVRHEPPALYHAHALMKRTLPCVTPCAGPHACVFSKHVTHASTYIPTCSTLIHLVVRAASTRASRSELCWVAAAGEPAGIRRHPAGVASSLYCKAGRTKRGPPATRCRGHGTTWRT
eukprot:349632-Chlamydomonas_euryale.AAC.33